MTNPRIILYPITFFFISCYALVGLFQRFVTWEDSSFCLNALNQYLGGTSMVDFGFPYGPAYFWFYWLVSFFTGPLDEASIRLVTAALWITGTLLLALMVDKITKNYWLGILTFLSSFSATLRVVNEPGLANSLAFFLTTLCLACCILPSKPKWFLCGFLAASSIFVKVNLGIFLVASLGFVALLSLKKRWFRYLWSAGMLGGPIVLMFRNPDIPLLIVVLAAVLQLVLMTNSFQVGSEFDGAFQKTIGGIATASVLMLLGAKAEGFTLSTLVFRLLGRHLEAGKTFFIFSHLSVVALLCIGVGLILYLRSAKVPDAFGWLVPAAGVFGVVIQYHSVLKSGADDSYVYYYVFVLGLIWLLKPTCYRSLLLLSVGCLQLLGSYPVSGAQMSFGGSYLLAVGFLIAPRELTGKQRWIAPSMVAGLTILMSFQLAEMTTNYRKNVPSTIASISPSLRLVETEWFVREWLLYNIMENADAVVTVPGMLSYANWTGVPVVQKEIVSTFPYNLTPGQLDRGLLQTQKPPNTVTIYQPAVCRFWNRTNLKLPQVDQYLDSLELVGHRYEHFLLVPSGEAKDFRFVGAWLAEKDEASTVLEFRFPKGRVSPAKVHLEDLATGKIVPGEILDNSMRIDSKDYPKIPILRAFDQTGRLLYRFPVVKRPANNSSEQKSWRPA